MQKFSSDSSANQIFARDGCVQAQCFATISMLNDMFPGNGVQRDLRYVCSCLVGVSKMSAQSAATCI